MHKKKLGSLEVSPLGLGCMGMTGFYGKVDRDQCMKTIQAAFDNGISFFDTADNYGFGENEALVGAAIAPFRDQVSIATKVGVQLNRETPSSFAINGTKDYIKTQCLVSLKRLGIPAIDLYYLHHVDPKTPIEESIQAMADLVAEGKVLRIGLFEASLDHIRRAHEIHPITAVQAEYSLFSREANNQLISLCHELDIGFVACAPLCRGLLGGQIKSYHDLPNDDFRRKFPRFEPDNLANNNQVVQELNKLALAKQCSLAQLALSWISAQSIVPLFGTTRSAHLLEDIKSAEVLLNKTDLDAIEEILSNNRVLGSRHPEMAQKLYKNE